MRYLGRRANRVEVRGRREKKIDHNTYDQNCSMCNIVVLLSVKKTYVYYYLQLIYYWQWLWMNPSHLAAGKRIRSITIHTYYITSNE